MGDELHMYVCVEWAALSFRPAALSFPPLTNGENFQACHLILTSSTVRSGPPGTGSKRTSPARSGLGVKSARRQLLQSHLQCWPAGLGGIHYTASPRACLPLSPACKLGTSAVTLRELLMFLLNYRAF